jgi:hypothetical protein
VIRRIICMLEVRYPPHPPRPSYTSRTHPVYTPFAFHPEYAPLWLPPILPAGVCFGEGGLTMVVVEFGALGYAGWVS